MKDLVEIPRYAVIQYLRNKKRIPYGVVVAVKDENAPHGFRLGYSLCNKRDRFTKIMALKVAFGRASVDWTNEVPPVVVLRLAAFVDRCKRYYKVA